MILAQTSVRALARSIHCVLGSHDDRHANKVTYKIQPCQVALHSFDGSGEQ